MARTSLDDTLLEAAVTATLQGRDLAPWQPATDGYGQWQAVCRRCGRSVAVSSRWLYSLLAEECPGTADDAPA